jgi:hypothetical protein
MAGWIAAAMLLFSTDQLPPLDQRQPPPPGNQIVVQDGDTIVVERDARVRIVRRTETQVRMVFNATERWLIVLADSAEGGAPDGQGRFDAELLRRHRRLAARPSHDGDRDIPLAALAAMARGVPIRLPDHPGGVRRRCTTIFATNVWTISPR